MAIRCSILAWRIPWSEEPARLQSIESQRVEHDWSDWACMHIAKKKKKCLPDTGFIITHYKAEHRWIDTFELWCWRRFLRVLWTARWANQSIKEINPEYSLERLTLKLMLQNFGHLMRRADSDSDAGKNWRQEEKGATGDEMFGWHHQLNGHESVQAPGDGEEQGSLVCCRVRHD